MAAGLVNGNERVDEQPDSPPTTFSDSDLDPGPAPDYAGASRPALAQRRGERPVVPGQESHLPVEPLELPLQDFALRALPLDSPLQDFALRALPLDSPLQTTFNLCSSSRVVAAACVSSWARSARRRAMSVLNGFLLIQLSAVVAPTQFPMGQWPAGSGALVVISGSSAEAPKGAASTATSVDSLSTDRLQTNGRLAVICGEPRQSAAAQESARWFDDTASEAGAAATEWGGIVRIVVTERDGVYEGDYIQKLTGLASSGRSHLGAFQIGAGVSNMKTWTRSALAESGRKSGSCFRRYPGSSAQPDSSGY